MISDEIASPALGVEAEAAALLSDELTREQKAVRLEWLAQTCRLDVLDMLHEVGSGHWGGAASVAEILTTLYFHELKVDPAQPRWPGRDRLVLSKGHASAMLYCVLARRGFFPREELKTFRRIDSRLQGHPCMNKTPGVDMSTGALGHGLSVGLGMALAARATGLEDYGTWVIVGEGCLNEGQTWEAIMAAGKFRPRRLVLLVDYNRVQLDGPSPLVMPLDPLDEKLRAFGWQVAPRFYNGHDAADIMDSFDWIRKQSEGPLAVIYHTVKGRGVSFMENTSQWHGAPVTDEVYAQARPQLLARLSELEVLR